MKTIIFSVAMILVALGSSAQPGSITNLQVSQGTGENERLVSIQFDLSGSDTSYDIALEVSFNNGATFSPIDLAEITGPLNVAPGTGIQFVWDGRISYPQAYSGTARIRITATPATTDCTFTDPRDGNTYKCVVIGDQVWMAENLKYLPEQPDETKISETVLTLVGPGTGSEDIPYAYVYDYDGNNVVEAKTTENYHNYGVLYNWPAAMGLTVSETKSGNLQGVCPPGWHVPSNTEWMQLIDFLTTEYNLTNNADDVENGVGNRLKSCRQVNSPIGGDCATIEHPRWEEDTWSGNYHYGTNDFGFAALPAGYRYKGGVFSALGGDLLWWSTDENPPTDATARHMLHYFGNVYQSTLSKAYGFSVRCVKD